MHSAHTYPFHFCVYSSSICCREPSNALARLPAGQQIQKTITPRVLIKVCINNLHIHTTNEGDNVIGDIIKKLVEINEQESDSVDY